MRPLILTNRPIYQLGYEVTRNNYNRGGSLFLLGRYQRRPSSGRAGEQTYIDQWFCSIVKPDDFYENHSASSPRRYFYNVDLQGRLFLEETIPKNIATSIKDERFLNFFFRMVRPVGPREAEIMTKFNICGDDYPFVSPCGKELNFIRPAATPIVFHSLSPDKSRLIYAGNKSQDFEASGLAVSKTTGRLFHRCTQLEQVATKTKACGGTYQFALIRSAVVVALSEQIGALPEDAGQDEENSGLAFFAKDQESQPIVWLPEWAEPGSWAMPFSGDDLDVG